MKQLFIIANWKAHDPEARNWVETTARSKDQLVALSEKEVVLCPPFTMLEMVTGLVSQYDLPIKIGGQDVSQFATGAFTGEMPAELLKEYAEYCIIGHSERRQHFSESDEIIAKKIIMARQSNIKPILCVQDENTSVPDGVEIVAYEPISAIGSGNPDTPENANAVAKAIKEKHHTKFVLYGGSVNGENVRGFTQMEHIDGVLVGTASLDPTSFEAIYRNA